MSAKAVWLRNPQFDVGLQIAALFGILPALVVYAAFDGSRASSMLPLGSLIAIPFLHVFGSFFFAFSERNRSPSRPRRLAVQWALWIAVAAVAMKLAPRVLATFALLYGGWHILRQNFGFLRELAFREGRAGDRRLRRWDLAACIAPAVALWLFVAARGPWAFLGAEVFRLAVPTWLLAAAFVAVPATIVLRGRLSRASLLLLAGNALALLAPALLVDDLLLIYTLSASYHGMQYLAYLAEREREANPDAHPTHVLLPLASAVLMSMFAWFAALGVALFFLPGQAAQLALVMAWYAIVPFHYFVDGRIWRRR